MNRTNFRKRRSYCSASFTLLFKKMFADLMNAPILQIHLHFINFNTKRKEQLNQDLCLLYDNISTYFLKKNNISRKNEECKKWQYLVHNKNEFKREE